MHVPACLSVCLCARVSVRGTGGPPPRGEPASPARSAAGQHQVAPRPPQPHAQVAVRPGRGRVRILSDCRTKAAVSVLELCSAGAWPTARLAPSPHANFLSSECSLFYLPLSSGRRRAAPRGEGLEEHGGLFSCRCAARPCRGALPQPRARQLRVLPGRTRAGSGRREAEPGGEPGPPLRVGAGGRAGAPGCPRSCREPRPAQAGEGASTAPHWALIPRSPPQKLGCKGGRRLVQRRHVSPGARGTR